MQFVRLERNDLIQQLKEFINLIKKCPKDMQFHACIEFSGIDKEFMKLADKYAEEKMKRQAKEKKKQDEQDGNI